MRGGNMKVSTLVGVAVAAIAGSLVGTPVPSASAEPCPDVEVIFARGTGEPPGVGGVGQAFVDAVQSTAAGKSVSVYPGQLRGEQRLRRQDGVRADGHRRGQGRGRSRRVHRRQLPQHPDRARRLLARCRGSGVRDIGRRAVRSSRGRSSHSRCPPRWPTTSPRSSSSVSRRTRGRAATARPRSRSGPRMRRRPRSCAPRATRSATGHLAGIRPSRTLSIR